MLSAECPVDILTAYASCGPAARQLVLTNGRHAPLPARLPPAEVLGPSAAAQAENYELGLRRAMVLLQNLLEAGCRATADVPNFPLKLVKVRAECSTLASCLDTWFRSLRGFWLQGCACAVLPRPRGRRLLGAVFF